MGRVSTAVGAALLYASAYYLPLLTPHGLYFIPSFFDFVVFPALVCVLVLVPLILLGDFMPQRWRNVSVFPCVVLLALIASKSLFDAAGFPWITLLTMLIPDGANVTENLRLASMLVIGITVPMLVWIVFLMRHRLAHCVHFLACLGYAFVLLATYRCVGGALSVHGVDHVAGQSQAAPPKIASRRVVWVIFDEMDYRLSLGASPSLLPNFAYIAARGVSATDAYSPGRATLYSIPALLAGKNIKGFDVGIGEGLNLAGLDGSKIPFDVENTIFSRLPGGPASAAVLGFYHPYCRLLPSLGQCHSEYFGNAGRWYDSLVFFGKAGLGVYRFLKLPAQAIPEAILLAFDPMYRVSIETLRRLDVNLQERGRVFDFIHLNFPHMPNDFAERAMRRAAATEAAAYRQNLLYSDIMLGKIIKSLEAQSKTQNILLIVSSDHWLRTASKVPAPVPFIVWNVGAGPEQARVLSLPLSTVHTSALALDYLNGSLSSQASMADFLAKRDFSPSWMAPVGYKEY